LRALRELGVACLKIEGRMKRPEYVGVVTKIFADALGENREVTAAEAADLEAAFSRGGFTDGYFTGQTGGDMLGHRGENTPLPETLFAGTRKRLQAGEARQVPLTLTVKLTAGQPVKLTLADGDGNAVHVTGDVPQKAQTRALTGSDVETQLSKTGQSVFRVARVNTDVDEGLYLPLSALNSLRRKGLEAIAERRQTPPPYTHIPHSLPARLPNCEKAPLRTVSLRRLEQWSNELAGAELLYLPAQEIAAAPERVETLRRACPPLHIAAVLPRVCWDAELALLQEELRVCRDLGVTDALVGTWDLLETARDMGFSLRGDYSLGAINSLTLWELKRLGFLSACVSFECNAPQIRDLSKPLPTELLWYGRLPLMLTEQCMQKNRAGGCRGCRGTAADMVLTDRRGEHFPVLPAWGCRTEIFNGKTLYLADKLADFRSLGLWAGRLSFTTETPEHCAAVFRAYQRGDAKTPLPPGSTRGLYYRKAE
jgi:putative protease